jgi:hypothetical protein
MQAARQQRGSKPPRSNGEPPLPRQETQANEGPYFEQAQQQERLRVETKTVYKRLERNAVVRATRMCVLCCRLPPRREDKIASHTTCDNEG